MSPDVPLLEVRAPPFLWLQICSPAPGLMEVRVNGLAGQLCTLRGSCDWRAADVKRALEAAGVVIELFGGASGLLSGSVPGQ